VDTHPNNVVADCSGVYGVGPGARRARAPYGKRHCGDLSGMREGGGGVPSLRALQV
jgi:hypothetical protein